MNVNFFLHEFFLHERSVIFAGWVLPEQDTTTEIGHGKTLDIQ